MVSISWFPSNNHHILVISITIFHLVYISSKPYIYIYTIYIYQTSVDEIPIFQGGFPHWNAGLREIFEAAGFEMSGHLVAVYKESMDFSMEPIYNQELLNKKDGIRQFCFFSWCWLKVLFPRDRNGGPVLQHMFFQSLQRDFLADFANSWEFINGIATNLEYLNQRSISHIHPPV